MHKLGVLDVEEWLKLTDKDGVDISVTERDDYFDNYISQNGQISYDEFKLAFLGTNMLDL